MRMSPNNSCSDRTNLSFLWAPHLLVRAQTHIFSRAHITVHNSYSTVLFQCGHTALAQGERNLFLCTHCHLVCHVLVCWSAWSIPFAHVLTCMLFVKTLSILNLVWLKLSKPLCLRSLEWKVWLCLANPTPNTGYEPNFHSYMNEEHTPINLPDSHRSFQCRDDATIISSHRRSRRFSAFKSIQQQQANRSKQGSHNVRIFRCEPLETVARS